MKTIIAVAVTLVLAGAAFGQTRHDEKPHGPKKKAKPKAEKGVAKGVK